MTQFRGLKIGWILAEEVYMKTALFFLIAVSISSCASSTGVIPTGADSYMISIRGGSGFADLGGLKADAYREATQFCLKNNKHFQVVGTSDTNMSVGVLPRSEINFMCLNDGDPQLTRTRLQPVPNQVIEVRNPASH